MKTRFNNQLAFDYILSRVDLEGCKNNIDTDRDKLQYVVDTFKSEYLTWNLKRCGSYQNTLAEWFKGLPTVLNIDFENYEILQIAKQWGSIPENATERQEQKILDDWFNFIALKFLQLCKKHKILIN